MRLALALMFGTALWAQGSLAQAATIWVNPSGSATLPYDTKAKGLTTISAGVTNMSGGDTLIIADGTYTGSNNIIVNPPNGSAGAYTIFKTETDFGVTIQNITVGNAGTEPVSLSNKSYIHIEGFLFKEISGTDALNSNGAIYVSGSNHIKLRKIGIKNGVMKGTRYGSPITIAGGSYHLLEDVFIVGTWRYGIQIFQSDYNVLRRVVARFDYANTREPKASIANYGGYTGDSPHGNAIMQNSIVLDDNTGSAEFTGGFTNPHEVINVKRYGSISLNQPSFGFHSSEDGLSSGNDCYNCIDWASGGAMYRNLAPGGTGLVSFSTFGYSSGVNDWGSGGTTTVQDSVFYNNFSGNNNINVSTRNNYWPASQAQGTNYTTLATPFVYITRSPIPGKGATVEKKYGVDGTLYGEPGYDQLTSVNLWPFPYENQIKMLFCEPNNPPSGSTPSANNTTRGFCSTGTRLDGANPITLTSYIWEYLGNACPVGICTGSAPDTIPPSAPTGLNVN